MALVVVGNEQFLKETGLFYDLKTDVLSRENADC
jgi:hypothetical protein